MVTAGDPTKVKITYSCNFIWEMAESLVRSTDRTDRYVRNKVWETEINANDTVSRGRQHGIMKFLSTRSDAYY